MPGLFSWDCVTMPMEFFPRSANSLEQTPRSFCNFVLSEPSPPTHYHACMYIVSELQSLRLVQCLYFPLTSQVYADREAFLVALLQVMGSNSGIEALFIVSCCSLQHMTSTVSVEVRRERKPGGTIKETPTLHWLQPRHVVPT